MAGYKFFKALLTSRAHADQKSSRYIGYKLLGGFNRKRPSSQTVQLTVPPYCAVATWRTSNFILTYTML